MKDEGLSSVAQQSSGLRILVTDDCQNLTNNFSEKVVEMISKRETVIILELTISSRKIDEKDVFEVPPLLKVIME